MMMDIDDITTDEEQRRQEFRTPEFTLRLTMSDGRDSVFHGDFEEALSDLSSSAPDVADGNPVQQFSDDDENNSGGTASGHSSSNLSCSDPSTLKNNKTNGYMKIEEEYDAESFNQEIECQLSLNDTLEKCPSRIRGRPPRN
jgi:hypothetical protein